MPQFQWKPLAPVAVRRTSTGTELLVAADTLETLLSVAESGAAIVAMRSVAAVELGDQTFVPAATETVPCRGGACMYRIALRHQHTEAA